MDRSDLEKLKHYAATITAEASNGKAAGKPASADSSKPKSSAKPKRKDSVPGAPNMSDQIEF